MREKGFFTIQCGFALVELLAGVAILILLGTGAILIRHKNQPANTTPQAQTGSHVNVNQSGRELENLAQGVTENVDIDTSNQLKITAISTSNKTPFVGESISIEITLKGKLPYINVSSPFRLRVIYPNGDRFTVSASSPILDEKQLFTISTGNNPGKLSLTLITPQAEEINLPISIVIQEELTVPISTPTTLPTKKEASSATLTSYPTIIIPTATNNPTSVSTTQPTQKPLPSPISTAPTPTPARPTLTPTSSTTATPKYSIIGLAVMPGNTDYLTEHKIYLYTGAYLAVKAKVCTANSCEPLSGYPRDARAQFIIRFSNGTERVIRDQVNFYKGWAHLYYSNIDWTASELAAKSVQFIFKIEGHDQVVSEPYTIVRSSEVVRPGRVNITGHVLTLNDPMVEDRHFYRLGIVGATVVIEDVATGTQRKTQSGTDGFYQLRDADPGTYNIYASWGGKASKKITVTAMAGEKLYRVLTVPIKPQEVWSQPGNIVGNIVDDWENPVTKATVSLYRKSGNAAETFVTSTNVDEFGRFRFGNQVSDVGYRIVVSNLPSRFNEIRISNSHPYYLDSNYGEGERGGTLSFTVRVSE